MPFGAMFHYFHGGDKHPSAQGTISSVQFEQILDRLTSAIKVLRAEEWAYKAENGRLDPGDVCLTFDDALRSQFDIALPVLRQRGLTAFWFVQSGVLTGDAGLLEVFRRFRNEHFPSIQDFYQAFYSRALASVPDATAKRISAAIPDDYLQEFTFYSVEDRRFRFVRDRVLQPEDYAAIMNDLMQSMHVSSQALSGDLTLDKTCLQKLENEGHIIGLHSHSHPTCLAGLPKEKQRAEYVTNYEILREILAEPPRTMAHPCNSYSTDTLEILRSLGIRIGFRSNTTMPDYSSLELPRKDSADLLLELDIAK